MWFLSTIYQKAVKFKKPVISAI